MIFSILKIYLPILLSAVSAAIIFFILGIYLIFKFNRRSAKKLAIKIARPVKEAPVNVAGIAGDDFFATQLDLARAFIETGKKNMAENILAHVVTHGTIAQQKEAQALLLLTKN